jgi:hypothetical protein
VEADTAAAVVADTVAAVAATAANKEVSIKHSILLTVALADIFVQDMAAAVDAVCSNCPHSYGRVLTNIFRRVRRPARRWRRRILGSSSGRLPSTRRIRRPAGWRPRRIRWTRAGRPAILKASNGAFLAACGVFSDTAAANDETATWGCEWPLYTAIMLGFKWALATQWDLESCGFSHSKGGWYGRE